MKIINSAKEEPIREGNKAAGSENEEVKVILPKIAEAKPVAPKYFAAEKKFETVDLRMQRNPKPMLQREDPNAFELKIKTPKREIQPQAYENSADIQNWKIKPDNLSPNFVPALSGGGFFPRFAFAMSGVLLLFLLIEIGWAYRNELKNIAGIGSGIVAGTEDSKMSLDIIRKDSVDYFENQEGKLKENISLSRALIRAAVERNNEQGSATSGQ